MLENATVLAGETQAQQDKSGRVRGEIGNGKN
jgi:hypothetical protein